MLSTSYQVVERVRGQNDPVIAIVESLSFGVENLTAIHNWRVSEPAMEGGAVTSLTSDTAIALCLSVFQRLDVDWNLHGFDSDCAL